MGRPKKTIQRKPSGIYMAMVWVDGKKYSKSLETKDELTATKRAAQAVRELQAQARAAQAPLQSKWEADSPDQMGTVWDIPSLPDRSHDYANARAREVRAADILEPEKIRPIRWQELLKEAVKVRRQKKGEDSQRAGMRA